MTQESEGKSLQINSGERLQVLQSLKKLADPFQEGSEAEKLRLTGLRNLCLQMANPSVEFVEKVSIGLGNISAANLHQLYSDLDNSGENPEKYFSERGVTIEDSEKLQEGISNSWPLIQEIIFRYDYKSGKLGWDNSSSLKIFAESIHERIQVNKDERQLRKMAKQIKDETVLEKRYRIGLKLKEQVQKYVKKFPFKFTRGITNREPLEPTWENLVYPGWNTELRTKDGGSISGSFGVEGAVESAKAAISRYQLETKLAQLPARDKEQFDQLRLKYGAKAANLIILSQYTANISKAIRKNYSAKLEVPEFQAVPVEFYRAWKEGKLTDEDLRPYFENASRLKEKGKYDYEGTEHSATYIVRSSAVFSEDGENLTGAGIYESVIVDGGGTFEDFKNAVRKVYESTNSPRAQAYRTQHGITDEEMGLIIQKFIDPDTTFDLSGQSHEGYVNSKLTGVPKLMEVVTRTSRNFVKRKELDFFLGLNSHSDEEIFQNMHHFPPDNYKIHPSMLVEVAQLASIVERIWKKDIQIEFVEDGFTINFVQVRELPVITSSTKAEIKFPDDTPVHSGASIGTGDLELTILNDEDDNSEKSGVVVFPSNDMWTVNSGNSYRLPKEGAVIVCHPDGKFGHIQTLCAEKGLICIFPGMNAENESNLIYHDLSGLGKVRIISDGIEGRVYSVTN